MVLLPQILVQRSCFLVNLCGVGNCYNNVEILGVLTRDKVKRFKCAHNKNDLVLLVDDKLSCYVIA